MAGIGFLAFAAYVLGEVASNAAERNKNQTDLIAQMVKDIRDCKQGPRMITLREKVSHFGGPDDLGVDPDEGLAFYYDVSDAPGTLQQIGGLQNTGLWWAGPGGDGRRPSNYDITPKDMLPSMLVTVTNVRTGGSLLAVPAD